MKDKQWEIIKAAARCEVLDHIPAGMIVDSPWIPGYCGVNTMDFYTDLDTWMGCYNRIKEDFPEMILLPDYWIEFGMASESVAFGCSANFFSYQPVCIRHIIDDMDDIDTLLDLADPDPEVDGFMPLALNYYRHVSQRLKGTDEKIRMVASRGPLNIVSFLMTVPEFCVAAKADPETLEQVIAKATKLCIRWLQAQIHAAGDDVEGILVLDDICGFLSEEDYLTLAHPYLKKIFDSFDVPVKMFHNDNFGNNYTTFPYIRDLGVNIFNFSFMADICEARKALGDQVCILGNIAPRDILTSASPEEVAAEVTRQLDAYGSKAGLILSAGGGASPGMPKENCRAYLDALGAWNASH